ILTVALAGIGAGGLVYGAGAPARRPTLVGFATTCVLEALCIALPYALGDRLAVLAMQLRPLGFLGFGFLVVVWLAVPMLVLLRAGLVPLGLGLASVLLCLADGPTAFWRHSAIGAGRLEASFTAPNDLRRLLDERRRRIVWEADGIESAVALDAWNAYGFLINGKNDGNTIGDAPTQVMLGLIGALQHPRPRTALVIGLGPGSTAGWLAQVR